MDIGLLIPLVPANSRPGFLRTLGQTAEAAGLASLWVGEHVVMFDEYASRYPLSEDGRMPGDPLDNVELEPFVALSFLAACTTRIRLGTAVCVLPQRNPVYTAKQAANLDVLSEGRLSLGLGLGWLAEEFRAVGAEFAGRGARMDSYVRVLKALWCTDPSEYHDDHYDLPPSRFAPKPVQVPHPPLLFGGETDRTFSRIAREGQGWLALGLSPSEVSARLERLDAKLGEAGRARSDLRVTVLPYPHPLTPETAAEYGAVGVEELVAIEYAEDAADLTEVLGRVAPLVAQTAHR